MVRRIQSLTAILTCVVLLLQPVVAFHAACDCAHAAGDQRVSAELQGSSVCHEAKPLPVRSSASVNSPACCGGQQPNDSDESACGHQPVASSPTDGCDCGRDGCRCGEVEDLPTSTSLYVVVERQPGVTINLAGHDGFWDAAGRALDRTVGRFEQPLTTVSVQTMLCRWLI